MKCLECFDSLNRQLDGDTGARTPEVEQHLAQCASCRREYAASELLLKGLKSLLRPMCPPDFAQRIAELVLEEQAVHDRPLPFPQQTRAVDEEPSTPSETALAPALAPALAQDRAPERPRTRRLAGVPRSVGFAVAASLLVVAGYFVAKELEATPGEQPAVVEAPQAPATIVQKAPEQPKHPVDPPNNIAAADPKDLEAVAQSLRQTGQGMAGGLQPMADTARRAFDYFFRELPVIPNGK